MSRTRTGGLAKWTAAALATAALTLWLVLTDVAVMFSVEEGLFSVGASWVVEPPTSIVDSFTVGGPDALESETFGWSLLSFRQMVRPSSWSSTSGASGIEIHTGSVWNRSVYIQGSVAIPGILLFIPCGVACFRRARPYFRARRGLCPTCGYNLTGNTTGVCPECAAKVEG